MYRTSNVKLYTFKHNILQSQSTLRIKKKVLLMGWCYFELFC